MLKTFLWFFTAIVSGSCLMGCGGGGEGASPRAKVYKVTGKVTYLNAPLIGAAVTFAPQGKQPAAVGRTNDAGEFTLSTYGGGDGAAEGDFKVLVMLVETAAPSTTEEAHSATPGFVPPDSHSGKASKAAGGNLLPAKFSDPSQTPLTAKVEPSGTNNFTFELK
jgi:hypothetical protein